MSSVFGPTAKAVGLSVNSLHVLSFKECDFIFAFFSYKTPTRCVFYSEVVGAPIARVTKVRSTILTILSPFTSAIFRLPCPKFDTTCIKSWMLTIPSALTSSFEIGSAIISPSTNHGRIVVSVLSVRCTLDKVSSDDLEDRNLKG